ncbi:immunoglobulin-like domain-containing protein [Cohnella herbarum]|uniref:Bacterial Ig-like domain-containing protein n=1 Tax=Cohnella herbarum TaxID=2728023 RepID=A0A7Z2VHU4_9BACL|nr:immunoglobulin-like domain-containing protein [Cohnella herbarum]QJD83230.1 hypothetical protein HH215_08635 [Cohnella herbarum]
MRLSVLLLLIIIIFQSACDSRTTSSMQLHPIMTITNPSKIKVSDSESTQILFGLDRSKYKRGEEIHSVITNNSSKEIQFGEDFILEKKINKTWMSVQVDNYPFPAIGYSLKPKGSKTSSMLRLDRWIEDGTYRIIKAVSFISELDNSDFYISSNEFEVK